MAYDLVIKGGTLIDGTGAPARRADLAITGSRIAEIGDINARADRVIDAEGLVVAPGFVDPHTHYDAQICWDRLLTPSSEHGVTTVIMGNCGVGIAPCRRAAQEVATWDLVNVEGIPFEVLEGWASPGTGNPSPSSSRQRGAAGMRSTWAFLAPLLSVPSLRDGGGLDGARRHSRGDGAARRAAAPGDGGGRGGLVREPLAEPRRLQGAPAGLAPRRSRGAARLRASALRDLGPASSRSR